jgi:dipeptidase D
MSEDIKGLVDTSENLGVARISESGAAITVSIRSTADERKEAQLNVLRAIANEHGAALSTRGAYPGWAYKQDSVLRDTCVKVYTESYGKAPEVITIHAGLECGIFAGKLEGLDCISIGPDNFDIHTTEEHLSLSSSERVWGFIKNVLKEIK